LIHSLILLFIF